MLLFFLKLSRRHCQHREQRVRLVVLALRALVDVCFLKILCILFCYLLFAFTLAASCSFLFFIARFDSEEKMLDEAIKGIEKVTAYLSYQAKKKKWNLYSICGSSFFEALIFWNNQEGATFFLQEFIRRSVGSFIFRLSGFQVYLSLQPGVVLRV